MPILLTKERTIWKIDRFLNTILTKGNKNLPRLHPLSKHIPLEAGSVKYQKVFSVVNINTRANLENDKTKPMS